MSVRSSCQTSLDEMQTTKMTAHYFKPYVYQKCVLKVNIVLPQVNCHVTKNENILSQQNEV